MPIAGPRHGRPDADLGSARPRAAQPRRRAAAYWAWAITAALVLGNLFLHKPISDVCDALFARIGRGPYESVTLITIAALSVGGALLLLARRGAALQRPRAAACLLALAVCTIAAQRWLLVSNVELIHLPQFGLLAALLLVTGLEPQTVWIAATLAGVLDETYQYLVIYAQVPGTYFDYNDIVLNAIGAAWAVVLGAAGSRARPFRWRGRGGALLVASAAALAGACWLAPPRLVASAEFPYLWPHIERAATGFGYHVMPASEGLAVLLLLWGVVGLAAREPRQRPVASAVVAAALVALLPGGCMRSAPPPPRPSGDDGGAVRQPQSEAPAPAALAGTDLIITFWCGPPPAELTDARPAEIAAAGFNVGGESL